MKNMTVDKRIRNLLQPQKYIVIDNFFDDPASIYNLFYSTKFYNKEKEIIPGVEILEKNENFPLGNWRGLRSCNLINEEVGLILQTKMTGVFNKLGIKNSILNFQCFLHITTQNIKTDYKAWHKDPFSYAGVIYMSKDPTKNSGTIFYNNKKELEIENVYNRFIMYDASILHRPSNCFGNCIETSRKTITFFITV